MSLYRHYIHRWERQLTLADTHRRILPFEWGLEWVRDNGEGRRDPLDQLKSYAENALRDSPTFFEPPPLQDWSLEGDRLQFPSPVAGPDRFNNVVYGRLFTAAGARNAVVVVPQWNADSDSHVALCRVIRRLGITALRLTLPYHEQRRPPGMKRADYMVGPNLGRTLAATRQAVLEVRQAVRWLRRQGYRRIGVMGTSIGSCVTYLAFVHDREIETGVFNHVSGLFADVVWSGLSTRYVRWGLQEHIRLEELRQIWAPISPLYFVPRLKNQERPHLLITARYDLCFLPELSEGVFRAYELHDVSFDRAVLPCGHYTTARFPFKYIDGWHICRYLYRHLGASGEKREGRRSNYDVRGRTTKGEAHSAEKRSAL